MQDVNTATFVDPWMEDTDLDQVKSFSEMLPHSSHDIFVT